MDPFALNKGGLYRTSIFGGMANGIQIKVKKRKGNKFMIKIRKSRYIIKKRNYYSFYK